MAKLEFNLAQKQSLVTSLSAAVAACLIIILVAMTTFIFLRGSAYFWPQNVQQITYQLSEIDSEATIYALPTAETRRAEQALLHYRYSSQRNIFNGQITLTEDSIIDKRPAREVATVRLNNGGVVIAKLLHLTNNIGAPVDIENFQALRDKVALLSSKITIIRSGEQADIHYGLAQMNRQNVAIDAPARIKLLARFRQLQDTVKSLENKLAAYLLKVQFADGTTIELLLDQVDSIIFPNQQNFINKVTGSISAFVTFISQPPKLDNTSGGVFPALFGTIMMVLLMTIIVTPIGVLAAVYLHEYAPQNNTTALIRISVNNLAGVPSIVYGVFGLGFFVYILGGSLDKLLFSEHLPSPTFGAPGIFWASLTMAILTLPVVIVATEEGLRRVPKALRNGSYALGATQAETVFKMVLPIASPGVLTGVILAIARGAGEVAPLMLVGAVKFAPALPIDSEFPFVHLQRQFMHLGVLIYDGAFHSQNVGNGSSFVFACCMLLLLIVLTLNLLAIFIRNRLRKQYAHY